MRKKIFWLGFLFCCLQTHAQLNKYLIRFSNKNNTPFSLTNPIQFLSQRAVDRRIKYNIPIDSSDLPINPAYLSAIQASGNVLILNRSKWLNQIAIETTDNNALNLISSLPFVINIKPIAAKSQYTANFKNSDSLLTPYTVQSSAKPTSNNYDYGVAYSQIKIHNGQFLHNHDFRGEGMQIAVIDDGFYHYDQLITFDSIRNNNQILGTWDFVSNEASVAEDDSHGMHCLSAITANIPGTFVGTAPKSSVYLLRSEDISSEFPIEEQNFAAATEYADSCGVDLCSVSLGYSTFDDPSLNYSYLDMDGNTSISARAADYAAKKGMLLVIAAGNEGTNSWHYITTPADADSILSVGALDSLGITANFSSYGPSSDGQFKPSVAAVGKNAVVANNFSGLPSFGSGTSYACPIMAGITTCLWQAFPEANNMRIINALELNATLCTNPNNRQGYGIPDVKKAFVALQQYFSSTTTNFNQCNANIEINLKTDATMSIDIERKFPNETNYTTVKTIQCNGPFGLYQYQCSNSLIGFPFQEVQYRYRVHMTNDTSYILDSTHLYYNINCTNIPPVVNDIAMGPNPANNLLNVTISRINESAIDIIMFNATGQQVFKKQIKQSVGTVTYPINLDKFPPGVYYINVKCDDEKMITKKIIHL